MAGRASVPEAFGRQPSEPRLRLRLRGRVLTDGRDLGETLVEVAGGRIARVAAASGPPRPDDVQPPPGGLLVPGLVDLHVHGAGGVDLASHPDPAEAVAAVAATLARHGVTAFCPTLPSLLPAAYPAKLRAFGPHALPGRAECLGAYLEGPFLSPRYRGVHDPRAVRPISRDEIQAWLATGPPAAITLAPELEGAAEAIPALAAAGVAVAVGHSAASAQQAQAALRLGASRATHLFNAMPPLHHREPGLAGALLADDAAILEVIADGVHLDPLVVDLAIRAAGPRRVALITDALAPAGQPPGASLLGDQPVQSDGIVARRVSDGTLAGSAILLDQSLRNVRAWQRLRSSLSDAEVVLLATATPASAIGVADRKGRIAAGYDADLVLLDSEWNVVQVFVRGQPVGSAGR